MTYKEAEAAAKRLHKALKDEACDVVIKRYMKDRRFTVIWKTEDEDAYELSIHYYANGELKDVTHLRCCAERYKGGLQLTSNFDFQWKSK